MGIDAGALYIITLGFGNQGVSNRVRNIEKWLYWPCLGVFRVFFGLKVFRNGAIEMKLGGGVV